MRTTLDIDDDVLAAARELATVEGKTMGQIISELARKALTMPGQAGFAEAQAAFGLDDWPTFPDRFGPPVTSEMVRRIEEEIALEEAVPFDHGRDAPRVFDDMPETGDRKSSKGKSPRKA